MRYAIPALVAVKAVKLTDTGVQRAIVLLTVVALAIIIVISSVKKDKS